MQPDRKLLHYNLTDKLGEGGMGVVWRATDTTLGRDVAIKILPPEFAADEERLARFDREARLLASLNHPNIAGIYGIHHDDGTHFLAMELIDGEDLAARLARGRLPIDETLAISRQVTAALEAAHSRGIVHRDLKPANVVLSSDGQAKVLDFGLAKAVDADPASTSGNPSMSPTMTSAGSVAGVLLGTAAYMSPEQARGKPVDRRADLWALGCLIYECLTGRQLFRGETISDSLAAVLRKDPDWSNLPPNTPPLVRWLLHRCLTRDPSMRLQDAGVARVEFEQAIEDPQAEILGIAGAADTSVGPRISPLRLALTALALIVLAAGATWLLKPQPAADLPSDPIHVAIPIPDHFESIGTFDLSPDGQTLAVVATEKSAGDDPATASIYVRTWADPEFRKLPGTERARFLQFSPQGDRLKFGRRDELRPITEVHLIPIEGGPVTTLYTITQRGQLGGSSEFLNDDEILVTSRDQQAIYRLNTSGGEPEFVFRLEPNTAMALEQIRVPRPVGRFVVVQVWHSDVQQRALHRIDLETKQFSLLLDDAAGAMPLSNGYIVFFRDEAAWIAPFDPGPAEVTGPAQAILSDVLGMALDHSGNHLIYVAVDTSRQGRVIVVLDGSGKPVETLTEMSGGSSYLALAPDGRRLAYEHQETNDAARRIWVLDMSSRLTRPVTPEGVDAGIPGWAPDGRLAYSWRRGPEWQDLMVMDATPGATPEPLLPRSGEGFAKTIIPEFSPDGQYLIVADGTPGIGDPGLYLYDVGDGDSARAFFASSMVEGGAEFRPDGEWVAYHTNGTGRFEVYLRRFVADRPESAPIHPVTRTGGIFPLWAPDGKTLYYWGPDAEERECFAVTVETEPELVISEPRRLFTSDGYAPMQAMSDGRFVRIQPRFSSGDRLPDLRLVLNWNLGRRPD